MKTTFLYTLSDPETGKIRYLGKSDNPFKRFKKHLKDRDDSHKSRWVRELKSRGLQPNMDLLDEIPDSQWEFWEREYIRVFRAIGFDLTNATDGGEGLKNPSIETRKKMSKSHAGVPLSPEHIKNARAAKIGISPPPWSFEQRAAARDRVLGEKNPNYGKPCSEERRKNIGAANKDRGLGVKFSIERRKIMSEAQIVRRARERGEI